MDGGPAILGGFTRRAHTYTGRPRIVRSHHPSPPPPGGGAPENPAMPSPSALSPAPAHPAGSEIVISNFAYTVPASVHPGQQVTMATGTTPTRPSRPTRTMCLTSEYPAAAAPRHSPHPPHRAPTHFT